MPANENAVATPVAASEVEEQVETAVASEATPLENEDQENQDDQEQSPRGLRRKVDKLTREKYELTGATQELRRRLEAIEQRISSQSTTTTARQEAEDPRPTEANFQKYDDFVEALTRWAARQEHQSLSAKDREAQAQQEQQERERETFDSYQERSSEFRREHPDFNEVVGRIHLAENIASGVQVTLMEDDNGPALAYYLGQHPEECQRLSQMTQSQAVLALGRISARVFPETAEAEEEQENSVASSPSPKRSPAAPIRPVKRAAPTDTELSDSLSPDEWMRRRNKQIQRRMNG